MKPRAQDLLANLVGETIFTPGQRKPNTVLRIEDSAVVVATRASPSGKAIPISDVQSALDSLYAIGEVAIHKDVVGYRSAFVGAVLATVPDAEVLLRPCRIRLRRE